MISDAQNTAGAKISSTPATPKRGPNVSQMVPIMTRAPIVPQTLAMPVHGEQQIEIAA